MEQRQTGREAACVSLLHWLGRDSSAADVDRVDSLAEPPLKSTIRAQVRRAHRVSALSPSSGYRPCGFGDTGTQKPCSWIIEMLAEIYCLHLSCGTPPVKPCMIHFFFIKTFLNLKTPLKQI